MLAFTRRTFGRASDASLAARPRRIRSLPQSDSPSQTQVSHTALERCVAIRTHLSCANLFGSPAPTSTLDVHSDLAPVTTWRISPRPFLLDSTQLRFFTELGPHLLSLYRALNQLYLASAKGTQPTWVADYLDRGKPSALVQYSRMKRFRDALPAVIRPDVIPTQDGMVITELDSVPGGIGLTACLSRIYHDLKTDDSQLVGGRDGMVQQFGRMLHASQAEHTGSVVILISEEAKDYRPEMSWLAEQLRREGMSVWCAQPREIRFTEEGLRAQTNQGELPVGLIYRFYELFDLLNIPKSELVQYAVKKELVAVTPPYKPALEEKSAFALFHHPVLRPFWEKALGLETMHVLKAILPKTWVLDSTPIPPMATIPDLHISGRAAANWSDLETATQKERQFVMKPSGFSELAWGSRGVSIGHDMPQGEWVSALRHALSSFATTPYILQEFHKGRVFDMDYLDERSQTMVHMQGRARLSPYYFVSDGKAELAGILATVCPADKKILHGMKDAIMVPCALRLN